MLDWLCRRYPARFAVDWEAGVAETLTEGYRHTFRLADFAGCPVRLCAMLVQVREDFDSKIRRILGNLKASSDPNRAMLVQEELALMREEPCEPGSEADEREGGLGLQHRFVAGCSCAATTPAALAVLCLAALPVLWLCCTRALCPAVVSVPAGILCVPATPRSHTPGSGVLERFQHRLRSPCIELVRAGASRSIWPRRRT